MDDDGDWITARYLLASILGRDPMVVDYVDEESFPVDPPPARLAEAPAEWISRRVDRVVVRSGFRRNGYYGKG